MNNLEIDELLVKYLLGSATADERQIVMVWLEEGFENKRYFDQLRDIYYLGKVTKDISGFDRQKALEEIKAKYYKAKFSELASAKDDHRKIIRKLRITLSIAATLILIIGISFFLYRLIGSGNSVRSTEQLAYNEIVTPKGARTNITLPDGTNVWLNAGSRIKYAMDFIKDERVVYLTGEAFFDVAKSKSKVFIVNTGNLAVKAWGTKFNVKAYPEESTIKTTLVEGSVSIKNLDDKKTDTEEYLKPNETAIFYKDLQNEPHSDKPEDLKVSKKSEPFNGSYPALEKIEVKTELFTSWKDSKWIIDKMTLEQLVPELERRYNVEITLKDSAIGLYKVSGSLENETFDQVLKIIKFSVPIDYEIKSNRIFIMENKTSKNIYEKFLKK